MPPTTSRLHVGNHHSAMRRSLSGQCGQDIAGRPHLAMVVNHQGKHAEAESLFRRAVDGYKANFGPDHEETLSTTNALASALLRQEGKRDEAARLFCQTLEAKEAKYGKDHESTLVTAGNYAKLLAKQGKMDEALPLEQQQGRQQQRHASTPAVWSESAPSQPSPEAALA